MLFKPDLEQCKLNQHRILKLWEIDDEMKKALDSTIDVFLIPESIEIYNHFSSKKDESYLSKDKFYDEFIELMRKYYRKDEVFYILYCGNTSALNKFGFSEQSYPIFSVTYKNLIDYWSSLIKKKDFFTLIISDISFNTVIDISDIDNHAENPDHTNDYTVFLKTNNKLSSI
ncbi:hypothetical protein [Neisseria zalophi]|uniref:Uncharacterized protein n=1 Tax=Neisseria zalophi TaxID=640030 RepID=A0A5J6PUU7_9NEIS|nr:hypothetical protein [Neisseria zalophi]QEY26014.1 hypothetical protein D0T92_05355 [Neisseria zalophi]